MRKGRRHLLEASVAIQRRVENSSYRGHENREQEEIKKHDGQAEEQAGSALRQTKEPSHRIRLSYDPTCGSGGQVRLWLGRERKPCVDCLFSCIGSAVCNGLSVPIAPCA